MIYALQMLAVVLVVVAFTPAFAHALELPGKMRLDEQGYRMVQPIYYPGFTIAGMSEPLAIAAALVLLVLLTPGSTAFWLAFVALLGLIAMHGVYWFITHPVNRFWVEGTKLHPLGKGFFSAGGPRVEAAQESGHAADWTAYRDRWEYSHVVRAACAAVSLIALILSIGAEGAR